MSLRFQKEDEADKEVKRNPFLGTLHVFIYGLSFLCIALVSAVFAWLSGETLKSYGRGIFIYVLFLIAGAVVEGLLSPIYEEFRIRTKEIDGKVSAIEEAVNASKAVTLSRIEWTVNDTRKDLAGLLERLTAIEEKLAEIQDTRRV
jgi:hypothetical protein